MKYFLSTLILVSAAPALAAQTEGPKSERLDRPPHQQQDRVRGQRGEGRQRGGEERQRPSKEEILKRFDANGDGTLDETEKARLRAAVEARRSELGKRKKEGKVKGGRGEARRQGEARGGAERRAQGEARGGAKRDLPRGGRGDVIQRERPQGEGSRRGPRQGEAQRQRPGQRQGEGQRREQGPPMGQRQDLRQQRRQELLQRFDANGDGQLNEQERQALKTAMEQRRAAQGEQRPQRRAQRQTQSR